MSSSVPNPPLLGLKGISFSFGAQPILQDVSLTVHDSARIGLIGPNGAGKSTLLRIMGGQYTPSSGEVTRRQGLQTALLDQQSPRNAAQTVGERLRDAQAHLREVLAEYHQALRNLAAADKNQAERKRLAETVAELQYQVDACDAWRADERLKRIRVALRLPEDSTPLDTLSGGELRRVDLACAVLPQPGLLLLDEPTNHVDLDTIEWIESYLATYAGACVFVTHDRYFLERLANRIVELDEGGVRAYPGNYDAYLNAKAAQQEHELRREANRQRFLRRELEWVRRMPKARGTKAKDRLDRFDAAAAEPAPKHSKPIEFLLPPAPRLGKRVLEAESISRRIGGRTLFRDFSLILQRSMRAGVAGPNGAGKTTLLRTLMGLEPPDEGRVRLGDSTQFLYIDQTHAEVDPDMSVLKFVSGGSMDIDAGDRRLHVPAYLEQFLFDRSVLQMAMGRLSGGERNRLDLARKFMQGGNVLVLDEPTNDLDLGTLRVLEELIAGFDGCVLMVSHDRFFLNRLATHFIMFEDDGNVTLIAGNYDDWLRYKAGRDRHAAAGASAKPAASTGAVNQPARRTGRRLTWHEKRELDGIEAAIVEAEGEVERLEAEIHAPGFYEGDHETVRAILHDLEDARGRVDRLYTRWAELDEIANAS